METLQIGKFIKRGTKNGIKERVVQNEV